MWINRDSLLCARQHIAVVALFLTARSLRNRNVDIRRMDLYVRTDSRIGVYLGIRSQKLPAPLATEFFAHYHLLA